MNMFWVDKNLIINLDRIDTIWVGSKGADGKQSVSIHFGRTMQTFGLPEERVKLLLDLIAIEERNR